MSLLLDSGTEIVRLYPEVDAVDDDGNPIKRAGTEPLVFKTRLHPMSSSEANDRGITVSAYYFTTRELPAGTWAKVQARGVDWDVYAEPLRSYGSSLTRNVRVIVVPRGSISHG